MKYILLIHIWGVSAIAPPAVEFDDLKACEVARTWFLDIKFVQHKYAICLPKGSPP